jgi:hypothetical protein
LLLARQKNEYPWGWLFLDTVLAEKVADFPVVTAAIEKTCDLNLWNQPLPIE